MQYLRFILFLLMLAAAGAMPFLSAAFAQELVEQEIFLNARIGGKLVRLEAFAARMKDAPEARLPIALITHGKPPSNGRMSDMRAMNYAMHARDFARRGYLAVVVMRRGFGRSDGPSPVDVSCQSKTFGDRFEADADELEGALGVIVQRPEADPERIVAIGASAGGAAVLALAARNPRGLRAVINVSGGLRIEGCGKDELLVTPVSEAGGRSKVKAVWIYAENDSLFPPVIVDKMHEGYLNSGGDVRRVRLPVMGEDGHLIFNTLAGRRAWLAEADALLRDAGLPTWTQANVRALLNTLNLPGGQGAFLERYFSSPGEKALARSVTSGRTYFQFGAPVMTLSRERALRSCESREPKEKCEIVIENNEWAGSGDKRWIFSTK